MSAKSFQIHLDAVIVLVVLFSISIGANLYLWQENKRLFKANVDARWETQNMATSWKYMKQLYEGCREGAGSAVTADGNASQ